MCLFGGYFYFRYSNQIAHLSIQKLEYTNQMMIEKVSNYLMPAIKMSETSAYLFENYVLYYTLPLQLEFYTLSLVKSFPQLSASYFGDHNGNFIMTKRLLDQTFETTLIDSLKQQTIVKNYNLFNEKIGLTSKSSVTFDPRKRPWYNGAKERQYWTDVYTFYSDKNLGITASYPIFNQQDQFHGVFGIDIRLKKIEEFLTEHYFLKNASVFIVNEDYDIIIYPKSGFFSSGDLFPIQYINQRVVDGVVRLKQLNHLHTKVKFRYDGNQFYAIYSAFPKSLGKDWRVVTIIHEDDLTLSQFANKSLMISMFLFIVLFTGCSGVLFFNKIRST